MKQWLVATFGAGYDALSKLRPPRGGKRVLIHEILSLQIIITAIIGTMAIAGLYWGGQWVLQDNYSRWAMQWTQELNELGAPLFMPNDDEAILRLESFIDKYPEIDQVTYYKEDGSVMFEIRNPVESEAQSALQPATDSEHESIGEEMLGELNDLVGAEAPYVVLTRSFSSPSISSPMDSCSESVAGVHRRGNAR